MAKSAKKASKTKDEILDDELENLEDLEDLDDLDDLEDEDIEDEDDEDVDDEDEDDEDDDESDESDLEDLTVKELRARAREDGHAPSTIKGKNKAALIELIEDGVEEEEDEDEEEVEEAPKSKKSSKSKSKKSKSTPSRSRTTDGKVGVQEVAEAAGTTPRSLRMLLRKMGVEKDADVSRYEWSSLNHPEVKKILKRVKEGGVKKAQKESLDKLKSSKKGNKKGGAKRSKKKAA